jgi:hypothetical protein
MRRYLVMIGVPVQVLYTALCVTLGGCAGSGLSQSQRYELASMSYVLAVDAVTEASRAGFVTWDDLVEFNENRLVANAGLDEWESAIVEERPFDGVAAVNRAIDDLIRHKARAEQALREGADDGGAGSSGGDGDPGGADPGGG